MKKPKSEMVHIDEKGHVFLSEWLWKELYVLSGSKAQSNSGIRRAVKKQFMKLIRDYCEEQEKA